MLNLAHTAPGATCAMNLCTAWVSEDFRSKSKGDQYLRTYDNFIGFYHEHTRVDRDRFVSVKWGNIPEDWKHNFYKCNERNQKCDKLTTPYDYGSIMHYGKYLQGMSILRMCFELLTSTGIIWFRKIGACAQERRCQHWSAVSHESKGHPRYSRVLWMHQEAWNF